MVLAFKSWLTPIMLSLLALTKPFIINNQSFQLDSIFLCILSTEFCLYFVLCYFLWSQDLSGNTLSRMDSLWRLHA